MNTVELLAKCRGQGNLAHGDADSRDCFDAMLMFKQDFEDVKATVHRHLEDNENGFPHFVKYTSLEVSGPRIKSVKASAFKATSKVDEGESYCWAFLRCCDDVLEQYEKACAPADEKTEAA